MKLKIDSTLGATLLMIMEMLKVDFPEEEEEQPPEIVVPVVGEEPAPPSTYVPPAVVAVETVEIFPSPIIAKEEADAIRDEQNEILLTTTVVTPTLPTDRTLSYTTG